MLTIFTLDNGRLSRLPETEDPDAVQLGVWLDLAEPTEQERARVEAFQHQSLPDAEDLEEIEASSRSYVDAAGMHLSSAFLQRSEGREEAVHAALLLTPRQLITLHDPEIAALRLLRMRASRHLAATCPMDLVQELYEIKLDDFADTLEEIHKSLDDISEIALKRHGSDMVATIDELTRLEHRNSKVRLCLLDAQRDLAFLIRHMGLNKDQRRRVETLLRDADSLLPHCTFLFEKVGFLLQALQGAISIEQNQIIKIFSVVAVIFLPPTLIASIYGMNFEWMPELSWPWGYPLAIVLMILSAIAPYAFFKSRRWL